MKKQAKTVKTVKLTAEQKQARATALAQFTAGCVAVQSATTKLVALAKVALLAGVTRKELAASAEGSGLHPRTVQNVLTMAAKAAGLTRNRKPSVAYSTQAVLLALYCAKVYGGETTAKKLLLSARRFLNLKAGERKKASQAAQPLAKVMIPTDHGTHASIKGNGRAIGAAKLTKQHTLRNS